VLHTNVNSPKNQHTEREGPSPIRAPLFQHLRLAQTYTEWGLPHGRFGRVIPLLWAGENKASVLWLTDQITMTPYPKLLHNIGLPLKQFHFIQNRKPLKNLKTVFNENVYKHIVLDTSELLKPGDHSFLARLTRTHDLTCFLIRPFFLSAKFGNPFTKHRLNVFFSLHQRQFSIQHLKGGCGQKDLKLQWESFFL